MGNTLCTAHHSGWVQGGVSRLSVGCRVKKGPQMAGDTRGSDTVHTRYARKGTPMRLANDRIRDQGRHLYRAPRRTSYSVGWCVAS